MIPVMRVAMPRRKRRLASTLSRSHHTIELCRQRDHGEGCLELCRYLVNTDASHARPRHGPADETGARRPHVRMTQGLGLHHGRLGSSHGAWGRIRHGNHATPISSQLGSIRFDRTRRAGSANCGTEFPSEGEWQAQKLGRSGVGGGTRTSSLGRRPESVFPEPSSKVTA